MMRASWVVLALGACGTPSGPAVDAVFDSAAVDSAAVDSAAVDSAAVDSAAVDSAAVDSVAVDSAAVDSAAVDSAAVDSVAVDSAAVDSVALDAVAAAPSHAVPTRIVVDDQGGLALEGFPGISADGMHVVYTLDAPGAALRVRIARLDDEVLKDHLVLAADERDGDRLALTRRLKQRSHEAERLLARSGVRGLVPLALDGMVVDGALNLRLPGFAPIIVPDATFDLARRRSECPRRRKCKPPPCAMPHRLVGLWAAPDHGVVVAHVEHLPTAACPGGRDFIADDWRVFPLPPAP